MKLTATSKLRINSEFGVKVNPLTDECLEEIENAKLSIEYGDLYRALHNVGDDFIKSDIEEALIQILDPDTFRRVVAVFKVAIK